MPVFIHAALIQNQIEFPEEDLRKMSSHSYQVLNLQTHFRILKFKLLSFLLFFCIELLWFCPNKQTGWLYLHRSLKPCASLIFQWGKPLWQWWICITPWQTTVILKQLSHLIVSLQLWIRSVFLRGRGVFYYLQTLRACFTMFCYFVLQSICILFT